VDAATNTIYKFNLAGEALTSFHSPGEAPTGLASDGAYLWLSTKYEARIYQFGIPQSVRTGDIKRVTFTVANTGAGNLVAGGLMVLGTDADVFNLQNDGLSGSTLAPATNATFDIVFAPNSPGIKQATLGLPILSPEIAQLNMPLKWTAYGAVKGDVDGDDELTLSDVIIAMQTLSGFDTVAKIRADYGSSGADIDADHAVGLAEALFILQDIAQMR
jgi:hypothetical protein